MKKIIWILIITGGIGALGYAIFAFMQKRNEDLEKQKAVVSNFEFTKDYLIKHYKWNYPIPSWNLILLDKTKMMIHLSDRNTPLNKIKNLYVIQWTTCNILKNDKTFQNRNYDEVHSIKSGNKIVLKRCFTYAVTADRKNFQIWTIVKKGDQYIAKLDWTIKDSITRSYSSPRLVKNGSKIDLPYPSRLSPVIIVKNLGNSKLEAKITDLNLWETRKIKLKEWINYLLSDLWTYNIRILWIIKNPLTRIDFVDVDGDLIHLKPSDKWLLNFEIKDYKLKGKKKSYIIETGKFLAEVLKLAPDTDMTVSHNGTTLVIRGTKFTVEANKDNFDTFLTLGHIVELLNWKKIDITLQKAFSMIKDSKIVRDIEKAKKLVSFSVFADVVNNPRWTYEVDPLNLTSVLTWIESAKRFSVSYDNWQKINLIKVKLSSGPDKFDKILKLNMNRFGLSNIYKEIEKDHWKGADRLYKNLVNEVCKSMNSWKGLDVSKLWYLLDTDKQSIGKLDLKKKIAQDLGLSNKFVILTSRHYNWQNSVVIWYDSNDKLWIRTINLKGLNYDDNVNTVVFACDLNE